VIVALSASNMLADRSWTILGSQLCDRRRLSGSRSVLDLVRGSRLKTPSRILVSIATLPFADSNY